MRKFDVHRIAFHQNVRCVCHSIYTAQSAQRETHFDRKTILNEHLSDTHIFSRVTWLLTF